MKSRCTHLIPAALLVCAHTASLAAATAPASAAAPAMEASRGKLLYDNHCIACHSVAVHWRSAKLATDWASLKEQVRLWQVRGQLNWTDADVVDVTRHLNETIYRFANPPLSQWTPRARPGASRSY